MNYEDLKAEIKAIAEIAAEVPEQFRERCFEVLLEHLLASQAPPRSANEAPAAAPPSATPQLEGGTIPNPSQVKVFLQRTGVTAEELASVVMWEDKEVYFIREPTTNKIARGQIEWSLLLALKSAIRSNSFSVDPEDVRSICQEKGCYDAPNFIKNFKTAKNAAFFSGAMEAQGEAQKLSSDGQQELGKLVKALAANE